MTPLDLDKMSNDYFNILFSKIQTIYIDISCLQDITLSALLHLITVEEEYEYILYKLEDYCKAYNPEDIESIFPVLKISNKTVNDFINNPKNTKKLLLGAPVTNLYSEFRLMLETIINRNKKFDNQIYPINIIINTYPLKPDEKVKRKFNDMFNNMCKCNISFMNKDITNEPMSFYKNIDYFILYNIINFLKENTNSAKYLISDGLFIDKQISALERVDLEYCNDQPEPIKKLLHNTEIALKVCTNFNFFKRVILTDK